MAITGKCISRGSSSMFGDCLSLSTAERELLSLCAFDDTAVGYAFDIYRRHKSPITFAQQKDGAITIVTRLIRAGLLSGGAWNPDGSGLIPWGESADEVARRVTEHLGDLESVPTLDDPLWLWATPLGDSVNAELASKSDP